jgi:hypothetical protein
MTRAVAHIPLIVLPDPLAPARVSIPDSARPAARRAVSALDSLHAIACGATDRWRGLDLALDSAARAARALAAELARTAPPVAVERLPATVAVHEYFGVRAARLGPEQAAASAAVVVFRGLADLRHATIDPNDLATEVAAMRLTLADLTGVAVTPGQDRSAPGADGSGHGSPPGPARGMPAELRYEPGGDGLERWIVGHHVYFLFNVRAAAQVHAALRALRRDAVDEAGRALARAADYVRGFTAAMAHSAALPAAYYRERVRHTMEPPAAPMNLTGRLQPEHRAYRRAIDELLDALPDSYPELAARQPALATARTALLGADLIDIERHVCVADALVGDDRSLVQADAGAENAVTTLRLMRHLRAARYCPLVPFGDHFAAAVQPTADSNQMAASAMAGTG